jgi:putative membrane protein
MNNSENILVVNVDRDNDLGKKTGIQGPVIGRKACIKAAATLALKDPTESDANSIFGAVKKYDEIKQHANVEIAILTGVGKTGFESDHKIIEQLEAVLEKFPATGFVLVTDGAEDDQIIPILQGKGQIISKETIIVKQANEVESTYYTIKQALQDPDFARTFLLVPGIIILLWGILAYIGQEKLFFTSMLLIGGSYLILKGSGLENKIVAAIESLIKSISLQRVSFPIYLLTIILFLFGIYQTIIEITINRPITISIYEAIGQIILYLALSTISFIIGKIVDAIQLKKAYYLRKYFLSGSAVFIIWFTLDSARQVLANKPYADLSWFGLNMMAATILAYGAYKVSQLLDMRKKITKMLIGLPVYSKDGKWIGNVETVKKKQGIEYKSNKTGKTNQLQTGEFTLSEGKIIIQTTQK